MSRRLTKFAGRIDQGVRGQAGILSLLFFCWPLLVRGLYEDWLVDEELAEGAGRKSAPPWMDKLNGECGCYEFCLNLAVRDGF